MTDFSASGSRTIMGAERFHGRVRDGIGWFPHAVVARRKGCGGAMVFGGSDGLARRGRASECRAGALLERAWAGSGWVLAGQAARSISTGRLHALPRVHRPPIHVVVFHGPSGVFETRERSSWGGLPA